MYKVFIWLFIALALVACGLQPSDGEDSAASTPTPIAITQTTPTPNTTPTVQPSATRTNPPPTNRPAPQQPTAVLPPTSASTGPGGCTNSSQFVSDVTIPDGTRVNPSVPFVKTWRMRNNGTCAWNNTYSFVRTEGTLAPSTDPVVVPNTPPGATADISVTLYVSASAPTGSDQTARFQLRDPNGRNFGQTPFVTVKVDPGIAVTTVPSCVDDSDFVSDVNVPDGTPVRPGVPFTKTWRIKNSGNCQWGSGYVMVKISTDNLVPTTTSVVIPPTAPGATVDVSIELTLAAGTPIGSTVRARFQMIDPFGRLFGATPYVEVVASQ
jgi:hypothetical protein